MFFRLFRKKTKKHKPIYKEKRSKISRARIGNLIYFSEVSEDLIKNTVFTRL